MLTEEEAEVHPKYACLKWEDWEYIRGEIENTTEQPMDDIRVLDAEVIRRQDLTAAPIFYTYSSIILSYRELLIKSGVIKEKSRESEELLETADHFHAAASSAEDWPHKKLPD